VIYLLRHGDAEDGNGDDAARRLTAKGERQARDAGLALAALEVGIEACLASPKIRALETARIACEALGVEVEMTEALRGGRFDALDLTAGRGDVLLVGHEPEFSQEVGRLTGAKVAMKKGGIAAVDGSTLVALWRPKELSRIAHRTETRGGDDPGRTSRSS
jgi:phosphohistidine phosphatase